MVSCFEFIVKGFGMLLNIPPKSKEPALNTALSLEMGSAGKWEQCKIKIMHFFAPPASAVVKSTPLECETPWH